jgi:hypothetical protein
MSSGTFIMYTPLVTADDVVAESFLRGMAVLLVCFEYTTSCPPYWTDTVVDVYYSSIIPGMAVLVVCDWLQKVLLIVAVRWVTIRRKGVMFRTETRSSRGCCRTLWAAIGVCGTCTVMHVALGVTVTKQEHDRTVE